MEGNTHILTLIHGIDEKLAEMRNIIYILSHSTYTHVMIIAYSVIYQVYPAKYTVFV